jgi:hypothetical protein
MRISRTQHVHDFSSLVADLAEGSDNDAINHR